MSTRPSILVIDDDKVDMMAVKRSLRELNLDHPVIEAYNGIEALDMLRGTHNTVKIDPPCAILLDLNMPRMSGHEFLEELRNDPELSHHLVFVMTTSSGREDRWRAYHKNVAGYVLKHREGRRFVDSMRSLEAYWQTIEFPE